LDSINFKTEIEIAGKKYTLEIFSIREGEIRQIKLNDRLFTMKDEEIMNQIRQDAKMFFDLNQMVSVLFNMQSELNKYIKTEKINIKEITLEDALEVIKAFSHLTPCSNRNNAHIQPKIPDEELKNLEGSQQTPAPQPLNTPAQSRRGLCWDKEQDQLLVEQTTELIMDYYDKILKKPISQQSADVYRRAYFRHMFTKIPSYNEKEETGKDEKKERPKEETKPVWTEEDKNILKEVYPNKTPEEIVKSGILPGRTTSSIKHMASRLGLSPETNRQGRKPRQPASVTEDKFNITVVGVDDVKEEELTKEETEMKKIGRPTKWTEEMDQTLIDEYHKTPTRELAKKLNIKERAIRDRAIKLEIATDNRGGDQTKKTDQIVEKIDDVSTEEPSKISEEIIEEGPTKPEEPEKTQVGRPPLSDDIISRIKELGEQEKSNADIIAEIKKEFGKTIHRNVVSKYKQEKRKPFRSPNNTMLFKNWLIHWGNGKFIVQDFTNDHHHIPEDLAMKIIMHQIEEGNLEETTPGVFKIKKEEKPYDTKKSEIDSDRTITIVKPGVMADHEKRRIKELQDRKKNYRKLTKDP